MEKSSFEFVSQPEPENWESVDTEALDNLLFSLIDRGALLSDGAFSNSLYTISESDFNQTDLLNDTSIDSDYIPDTRHPNKMAKKDSVKLAYGKGNKMLKQQLLQRLTNLRYKYNEGKIISSFGYDEVSFKYEVAQLFNKVYDNETTFQDKFKEIIWVSYRKNFEPLGTKDHALQSDCGWGCMIRCAQMLLAQSIANAYPKYSREDVIRHFLDLRKRTPPFSIYEIVEEGEISQGKKAGEWFGVASVSKVLSEIFKKKTSYEKPFLVFQNLGLVVFSDNAVIKSKILEAQSQDENQTIKTQEEDQDFEMVKDIDFGMKKATSQEGKDTPMLITHNIDEEDFYEIEVPKESEPILKDQSPIWTKNILVIVNMRLGINNIDQSHFQSIKQLFDIPFFMGIIGGKPNFALFFVGHQGEQLIFLDPHYVQESVKKRSHLKEAENLESYSCQKAKLIPLSQLDPCIGVGFLLKSVNDLEDFENQCKYGVLKELVGYFETEPKIDDSLLDDEYI